MGLYYLPEGGEINTGCRGFLVARGSLTLSGDFTFNGVLLHLGGGDLSIVERAVVTGGVWLSNLDSSGSELESRELTLRIAGTSRIRYDRETINAALRTLPATQLGWRIIFPEMQ